MALGYAESGSRDSAPNLGLDDWEELLVSMCSMLERVPPSAMTTVSMTGSLRGVEGSALALAALCKRLAGEHDLRQTVQVEGSSFTVRFSRRDGRRPVLRRQLGRAI